MLHFVFRIRGRERELMLLLSFTCNYVVSVGLRGFLLG